MKVETGLCKSKIFTVIIAVFLGILPFINLGSTVYASEQSSVTQTAQELEYIFTELYEKDSSGKYIERSDAITNSKYTANEINDIRLFVAKVNGDSIRVKRAWNDTVKRCIEDGKHIGQAALNEIGKEIQKGNWIAAATKLTGAVAAGGILGIPAALAFLALCGAVPAS